MQTHPAPKTYGPFKIVQPSHLRAVALTQEQRLIRLKQERRTQEPLLVVRALKAEDRRFSGEQITGFGEFA